MRVVVALGGNALLRRGEAPDAEPQREHVAAVAPHLAALAVEHELVIVHGNGPQVGLLALESVADPSITHPYPLSDLVAETQGLIGAWLQQAIVPVSRRPLATLISHTVVGAADPGFAVPTKFVGSLYTDGEAEDLARRHGWTFRRDGRKQRRVVASPRPLEVLEIDTAERLLASGVGVVVGGGGGVPVIPAGTGWKPVEAVVDKDLVACLIAKRLCADKLVILTDVPAVMADFGTPQQHPFGAISADRLAGLDFAAGSMGPKVEAAVDFVRTTGRRAAIGALEDAAAVVAGTTGTQLTP